MTHALLARGFREVFPGRTYRRDDYLFALYPGGTWRCYRGTRQIMWGHGACTLRGWLAAFPLSERSIPRWN